MRWPKRRFSSAPADDAAVRTEPYRGQALISEFLFGSNGAYDFKPSE
jgi:hypothetical protein